MSERLAWFVVVAVVTAWFSTTVVLPVAVADYSPPEAMNTVMGIVAGGAVAYIFAKRSGGNNKTK